MGYCICCSGDFVEAVVVLVAVVDAVIFELVVVDTVFSFLPAFLLLVKIVVIGEMCDSIGPVKRLSKYLSITSAVPSLAGRIVYL